MSITRRILWNVGFAAAAVLALVAVVTYRYVFAAAQQRVVEHLDTYVTERTRREEASFKVVYENLETARSLFLQHLAQPLPPDLQSTEGAGTTVAVTLPLFAAVSNGPK